MKTQTIYLHGYSGDREGLLGISKVLPYENPVLWRLPGFLDGGGLTVDAKRNISVYADIVWQGILDAYPEDDFRLVGHSHGAMVTFAIAAKHSKRIKEMVLICPVARPRLATRILAKTLSILATVLPSWLFMGAFRSRFVVSFIGLYMESRHWSDVGRHNARRIRRQESHNYSRQMIEMLDQGMHFERQMSNAKTDVPTTMCYATDDNISGKKDLDWYFSRCSNVQSVKSIHGGHLAVLAEPEYVAEALLAGQSVSVK